MAKKKSKLSAQQHLFVLGILKGLSQKEAYVQAGYKSRGAAAEANSTRLRKKEKIKRAIESAQAEAAAAVKITQQRILEEESRLAFYDPADLFDVDGSLLPVNQLPENIRRAIVGVEVTKNALGDLKFKYKFQEKGKSLDRLERIEGMFQPEKQELDLTGKIEIIDRYEPTEQEIKDSI